MNIRHMKREPTLEVSKTENVIIVSNTKYNRFHTMYDTTSLFFVSYNYNSLIS